MGRPAGDSLADADLAGAEAADTASALRRWLRAFWPAPVHVGTRERLRALAGGAVGIVLTGVVARLLLTGSVWPHAELAAIAWLVAPMGASAVLVFAVPASPLAQPWAVIGGNTISAFVGVACALLIPDKAFAGALAVAGAIAAMFWTRSLHPPGGASALLAVLSGATDFRFALVLVLLDSLLLVAAGVAYNSLTGRRYPHAQLAPAQSGPEAAAPRFNAVDLDAALEHYNQVLDVSRDDLEELLHYAENAAYRRTLGELRCGDIMSAEPVAVEFGTPLDEAWRTMRERQIKALPVIDRARRIIGIVTRADFLRQVELDSHADIGERMKAFLRRSGLAHSDKPEVVGQIMTKQVRVASSARHVIELVPLFSQGGHHHIPIIDAERRLAGVITQSDLVRALYQAVQTGSKAA